MPASRRIERLQSQIHEELALVLQHEMKDPRATFATTTVTRVKLAKDLRCATVFVSVMGAQDDKRRMLALLKHARGFLQARVAEAVSARRTPVLTFKIDESIEKCARVSALLNQITEERGPAETPPADAGEEE
ncbi:MAG: 30S ribosome-binding factor RbfA [Planctomycetes bacterium]|nr:30S ribosome-binding factor RbfA [Planctomycetota bacterium]